MAEEYFVEFLNAMPTKYDGVALDIGANHGSYTSRLSDKFHHVYAFEPHLENVRVLKKAVSGRDNVTIINKAIAEKTGLIDMWISHNHGGHSISPVVGTIGTWGHNPNPIQVNGITLDDFCQTMNVVLMKVDIEGAEDFIFRGAVNTLKRNKLAILIEVHQTVDLRNLYHFFKYMGYKWFQFGKEIPEIHYDQHYLVTNI